MNTVQPATSSLLTRLRNYFFTGVLVTAPVGLSLYIVWALISYVDNTIKHLLPETLRQYWFIENAPGIGLLIVVTTLIFIGALMAGFVGRTFFRFGERILEKMPLVRSIYGATKQILETMLSRKGASFDQVVLVEYPQKGAWFLGFVTGSAPQSVHKGTKNKELVSVFIPTTPLPTQGLLLFISPKDIKPLDMTVEQGLKLLLSAGMVKETEKH